MRKRLKASARSADEDDACWDDRAYWRDSAYLYVAGSGEANIFGFTDDQVLTFERIRSVMADAHRPPTDPSRLARS